MSSGNFIGPQTLGEHLEDLKKLVIQLVATFSSGIAMCVLFQNQIYNLILDPIRDVTVQNEGIKQPLILTFLKISAPMSFQIDILMFASLVTTSPVLLYWIWQYIRPALSLKEQKFASIFVIASGFLSLIGAGYAYKLILPSALKFFTGLNQNTALLNTQFSVDAEAYLEFFRTLFLSTLITFQIPLLVFGLLRSGVLPVSLIKDNKKILYFGLVAMLFVLVPGDISISILVCAPVIVLLELAIFFGSLGHKNKL